MENYSIECLGGGQEDSGFSSPGPCFENSSNCWSESGPGAGRRGRPKAAIITSLMKEGAESNSGIRCEICCRVFPRDKSLQAHLRVHTGERPYSCDYPGCVRKFKQSGQLKTHQRLHTGERPFLCSAQGCSQRFTHANRHCASHPSAALIRCDNFTPYNPDTAQSDEVRLWLIRYMTEKKEPRSEKKVKTIRADRERRSSEETNGELTDMTNLQHGEMTDTVAGVGRCNPQVTPLRDSGLNSPSSILTSRYHTYYPSSCRYEDVYWSEGEDSTPARSNSDWLSSPAWSTPLNSGRPPVKSLFIDSPSPTLSPRKRELPKKRWLRIARREEESSANSQRPTVLRYLAASPPVYSSTPIGYKVQPMPVQEIMLTPPHSAPRTAFKSLTESSPLLSRLLTMPYDTYEEDLTPLAVPLPHD